MFKDITLQTNTSTCRYSPAAFAAPFRQAYHEKAATESCKNIWVYPFLIFLAIVLKILNNI